MLSKQRNVRLFTNKKIHAIEINNIIINKIIKPSHKSTQNHPKKSTHFYLMYNGSSTATAYDCST